MLRIAVEVLKLTNLHLVGSNRVFLLFSGSQQFFTGTIPMMTLLTIYRVDLHPYFVQRLYLSIWKACRLVKAALRVVHI